MEKIKYCPKCMAKVSEDVKTCSCGYNFVFKEKEALPSNTKVVYDSKPLGLWTFLSFISLSICGFIWMAKWKEEWPERRKAAKRGVVSFYITLGVCVLIYLMLVLLKNQGKIV